MFDVVERIGLRKFVFPDFAPTGQPYASPGQRPGLCRDQDCKAPKGAVLGRPRWGSNRSLRNETPGDAWGYLRAAPLGRRTEQKRMPHFPCQTSSFKSPAITPVKRGNRGERQTAHIPDDTCVPA